MNNKKFEYSYYEGLKTTLSVNEVFYKTPIEGGDDVTSNVMIEMVQLSGEMTEDDYEEMKRHFQGLYETYNKTVERGLIPFSKNLEFKEFDNKDYHKITLRLPVTEKADYVRVLEFYNA